MPDAPGAVPHIPAVLDMPDAEPGVGNAGRFWEQVCALCALGQDGIADPFAAISAIPAATGAVRDMSGIRMEVPQFIAANGAPGARSAGLNAPTPRFRGWSTAPTMCSTAVVVAAVMATSLDAAAADGEAVGARGAAPAGPGARR